MKDKLIIIIVSAILIVLGVCGGYFIGEDGGKKLGYISGYDKGKYDSYEKGYSLGYDNGKEFIITHLDDYVTVPKAVGYDEVVAFLKEDTTDSKEYSEQFNCVTFANVVKDNAEKVGIRCGIVSFDLKSGQVIVGHAVNIFDTSDKGMVYVSPQDDGQRYGIYVGGTYSLSGITYKITKVDIIW